MASSIPVTRGDVARLHLGPEQRVGHLGAFGGPDQQRRQHPVQHQQPQQQHPEPRPEQPRPLRPLAAVAAGRPPPATAPGRHPRSAPLCPAAPALPALGLASLPSRWVSAMTVPPPPPRNECCQPALSARWSTTISLIALARMKRSCCRREAMRRVSSPSYSRRSPSGTPCCWSPRWARDSPAPPAPPPWSPQTVELLRGRAWPIATTLRRSAASRLPRAPASLPRAPAWIGAGLADQPPQA